MARSVNGTNSYFDTAIAGLALPLTMACWFRAPGVTITYRLMQVFQDNANNFALQAAGSTAGDPITATAATASALATASSASGYSANVWQHACGVFSSTTSRTAYLNGTPGTENTTLRAGVTATTAQLGRYLFTDNNQYYSQHDTAHAAIWNTSLTAAEVASLYNNGIGLDPRSIRPDALIAYWPLLDNDGDRDWWGSNHLTAYNTPTYTQHPPVLMKSRPTVVVLGGPSGPTISSVTISGTRVIGETLTATVATSPTPVDSIAYQWQKAATDDATPGTDLTGKTSQTLALSYADFGDLLDANPASVFVRCQAIATDGGIDSTEVASDWLSVALPATGGSAGGSLIGSSLII